MIDGIEPRPLVILFQALSLLSLPNAINNNLFDVLVMSVVGILGFVMMRFEVPAAPFLIAFILGPLLEDNFRQALLMSEGSGSIFFRDEICWVFWTLTAASIGLLVRNHWKARHGGTNVFVE